METATKQVEAPAVGSDLSGNTSAVSSPLHGTGGRKENFTRIDRKLYKAAVKGNFNDFAEVQNIENLLTPNANTVLHIYLTSQTTKDVSTRFVKRIIGECGGLVLQPNAKGETALHQAVRYGHSSITEVGAFKHSASPEQEKQASPEDNEIGIGAEQKQALPEDIEIGIEAEQKQALSEDIEIGIEAEQKQALSEDIEIGCLQIGIEAEQKQALSEDIEIGIGAEQMTFVEQILVKCEGLVLLPNAKGETPLHMAARYGHSSIAKLLIERAKRFPKDTENGIGEEKKLIRATNCEKNTALHEAVRYDHIKVVEILLEKDPDHAYSANNANETPLYLASERQYKVMVNKMLEVLKSPAYDGPNGQTALHAAVINRDIDMAEDLLKNEHLRAAVKHGDEKGWVPLHYAAKLGDKRLTELLLKHDEDTAYMQDNEGRTALHISAYYNHVIIMKMIIENYPDCSELVDNKGRNALHYAVNGDGISAVAKISKNLALSNLYNEKDVDGNTPLHHLATSNSTNTSFVFDYRVDKRARNKKGQTALDVAYANPNDTDISINQAIINYLKHAGARRSGQDLYLNSEAEQEKSQQSMHSAEENSEAKQEKSQQLTFSAKEIESHLIVAILIATVSFAAGFTLPGGTIQDGEHQGSPILGQSASFKAFIVSDTIALVLSASAAFIHLFSPMTKTTWRDQLLSETAFSFTLVAVAAMIVAFSTGTYAVLGPSSVGIAVLTTGLSFFIVFWHVLQIKFRGGFLIFILKIVDVIVFSFLGAPLRWCIVKIKADLLPPP